MQQSEQLSPRPDDDEKNGVASEPKKYARLFCVTCGEVTVQERKAPDLCCCETCKTLFRIPSHGAKLE